MFKKEDKKLTSNYGGINLLSTSLKLLTKIITNKDGLLSLQNEQQGFRSGRSCKDAVFVLRQITEKSIEYNKLAYICFIDLVKAFDRVQLKDIIHLLYDRHIPHNLVKTFEMWIYRRILRISWIEHTTNEEEEKWIKQKK